MPEKRRCLYCGQQFFPDPRVGDRQKACFKKSCQKQRHDQSHAVWWAREENKDVYCGRYENTKKWRADHPAGQRRWRAKNPKKVAKDNRQRQERRTRKKHANAEIQDAIVRREIEGIRRTRGAEIQDTIRLQITGILDVLSQCPWHKRAEIQDSMAPTAVSVTGSAP